MVATGVTDVRRSIAILFVARAVGKLVIEAAKLQEQLLQQLEFLQSSTRSTFTHGADPIDVVRVNRIRRQHISPTRVSAEVTLDL